MSTPSWATWSARARIPAPAAFQLHAWTLIYVTFLITAIAMILAVPIALLSSIFIVEFAPKLLRRVTIPVVRLLAAVPSVIYGLIGVLVLVPFVGNHIVTASEKASHERFVQLTGASIGVASLLLAVMITPIMVALITEALAAVPDIVARRRCGARRASAARDARRQPARDQAGDRGSRGARVRARAR